jgi:hypothetical protein
MAAISLKLSSDLLKASEQCAEALRLSRAEYIRRAIARMNRETHNQMRAKRLAEASQKVRKESMHVNAEFAVIERDPDFHTDYPSHYEPHRGRRAAQNSRLGFRPVASGLRPAH